MKTAFVNKHNFKNATAFFTNAFKREPALNKEYSFNLFALVNLRVYKIKCFPTSSSFLSLALVNIP